MASRLKFESFSESYISNFLQAMELSTQKIFGLQFTPDYEFESIQGFNQTYNCLIEVPFIGDLNGAFLIELNETDWRKQKFMDLELNDESMFLSAIKELLNVASSISLESLRKDHGDLKILSPKVVFGKILYPEHRFLNSRLTSSTLNPIYCHICFNETLKN